MLSVILAILLTYGLFYFFVLYIMYKLLVLFIRKLLKDVKASDIKK